MSGLATEQTNHSQSESENKINRRKKRKKNPRGKR